MEYIYFFWEATWYSLSPGSIYGRFLLQWPWTDAWAVGVYVRCSQKGDRSGEDYRTISAERRFLKALWPPTGDEVELRQLGQEQDWAAGFHEPHHAANTTQECLKENSECHLADQPQSWPEYLIFYLNKLSLGVLPCWFHLKPGMQTLLQDRPGHKSPVLLWHYDGSV